jgi:hypothetical protein
MSEGVNRCGDQWVIRARRCGRKPDQGVLGQLPRSTQAVAAARHHVGQVLGGATCAADALFALTEVAANAVLHSRSGQPGGWFTVAPDVAFGALAAVAVAFRAEPRPGLHDLRVHAKVWRVGSLFAYRAIYIASYAKGFRASAATAAAIQAAG